MSDIADYLGLLAASWIAWLGVLLTLLGVVGLFSLDVENRIRSAIKKAILPFAVLAISLAQYTVYLDIRDDKLGLEGRAHALESSVQRLKATEHEAKAANERSRSLTNEVANLEEKLESREERIDTLRDQLANVRTDSPAGPLPVANLNLAGTEKISSPIKDAPYGLKIILQTSTVRKPIQLLLTFSAPVHDHIEAIFSNIPTGMYSRRLEARGAAAFVRISSPPWSPEGALVIRVFSAEPIQLKAVEEVK